MSRYFLELAYKGKGFSGFQVQQNAVTIQSEVEKAFEILQKEKVVLTGSSRTDAGVHALQNYFHFDFDRELNKQFVYKMNAILPASIVIKNLIEVEPGAHCRFDALSREYDYHIYRFKNPFINDVSYYYPYKLSIDLLNQAACIIKEYSDFTSFSKRNTQVKSFLCKIETSEWVIKDDQLIYKVSANRFLRGMVRALTATMLKVGRQKMGLEEFRSVIEMKDCTMASFAVPAHGLFLTKVNFPGDYFQFGQKKM